MASPLGYLTAKDFVVMEGRQRCPVQVPAPVRREGWKTGHGSNAHACDC